MLKAYLDVGRKTDAEKTEEIICVVATVFKPVAYKQFVRPWKRMLDKWGASAFHATDFYSGGGEFERTTAERKKWYEEDSRAIPSMIGKKLTRVTAMSFLTEEFKKVASPKWKETFGTDTYGIAVQLCMISLGYWLKTTSPTERFSFVQESGDNGQGTINNMVEQFRNDPQMGPHVRIASFATRDKGAARGLEASDFVAWHWNKHYMDRIRKNDMAPRKDFAAFMKIAEARISTAFVSGEKLKYFFSVVEDKL
ncbi:MAG TPA: hypothetical protein VN902_03125 [Candidatus Acidoferrales bacterium]|nr:hypothetical protein [Candidatus Acidoferrales bacterium]